MSFAIWSSLLLERGEDRDTRLAGWRRLLYSSRLGARGADTLAPFIDARVTASGTAAGGGVWS
jgi:hypothetical protein